jgi:hypothetical protein
VNSETWRVLSYIVALHKQDFTGRFEISWENGVPKHTRTESGRRPDELPDADGDLVKHLQEAQRRSGA